MAALTRIPDLSRSMSRHDAKPVNPDPALVQRQLDSAIESAFSGGLAQERANQARKHARDACSSAEKERYEAEARDHQRQAQRDLQKSRRLQSGVWQGFGAGAGMGAAAGAGLGTVVGTLSGGVLAVPLSAVGGLVGAGTGMLHGPWVKLRRGEKGPEIAAAREHEPGAVQLRPEELEGLHSSGETEEPGRGSGTAMIMNKPRPGRKVPKKLELRGGTKAL